MNSSQRIYNLGFACLLILAGLKLFITGRASVKLFHAEGVHVHLGGLLLLTVGVVLCLRNLFGRKWDALVANSHGEKKLSTKSTGAENGDTRQPTSNVRPEPPKE